MQLWAELLPNLHQMGEVSVFSTHLKKGHLFVLFGANLDQFRPKLDIHVLLRTAVELYSGIDGNVMMN